LVSESKRSYICGCSGRLLGVSAGSRTRVVVSTLLFLT
jgi:hypothetical protein